MILYDYYIQLGEVFFKQDFTCPWLCQQHVDENERRARGDRKPRGITHYPHTNREGAQGMSLYFPINEEEVDEIVDVLCSDGS
ncbi:MAG: hypothetical protein HYV34_03525 [Candidatus Kerfeldbacteria bacterium]|nr:hypothetical protein [Candidatus Kerfeldbacteria bacterium]